MARLSVVVTSCNRPEHLARCLASLERQRRPPDEVVVADDGSTPEHLARVEALVRSCALPARLVRQPDRGFRPAAVRNLGARAARGELLFFADGDLVYFPEALAAHLAALDARGGWTTGFCVPLTPAESERLSLERVRAGELDPFWPADGDPRVRALVRYERRFRRKALLARLLPFESHLRKLSLRGGNACVRRADFEAVNGFDEAFVGWGCEDADLGLRLLLAGVPGSPVHRAARALHLHHPVEERARRGDRWVSVNQPYHKRPRRGRFRCERGLRLLGEEGAS